jgi:hypothetical protein
MLRLNVTTYKTYKKNAQEIRYIELRSNNAKILIQQIKFVEEKLTEIRNHHPKCRPSPNRPSPVLPCLRP